MVMAEHATVSATFPSLEDAESAVGALLQAGFYGGDAVVMKGSHEHAYVVTVAASDRFREVEDTFRRHGPLLWRTSIDDVRGSDDGEGKAFLHTVSEADEQEQDAPWLGELTEPGAEPAREVAEADWMEQEQSAYPQGRSSKVLEMPETAVSGSEADNAEQATSAYADPLDED